MAWRSILSAAVITLAAQTAHSADLRIERAADGSAWILSANLHSEEEVDVLFGVTPYWIVQCPTEGRCYARSGCVVLALDADGIAHLHLDPYPNGEVSLMIADFAFEMEDVVGEALSPTWEGRLRDTKAILLIEHDEATAEEHALMGLGMALDHLRATSGLKPEIDESTPLAALADAAQRNLEGGPRLIPDTKPQIEFAIRAQVNESDLFDVESSSPTSP